MTVPSDKSPDRITPGKALESDKSISQPPSTFETYMQEGAQTRGTTSGNAAPTQSALPTGATQPGGPTGAPNYDTLISQARNVQDGLGTVEQQLQTPNLKLKRSQTHLLKNKMQDTNEYIRASADKLGVQNPAFKMPAGASPVGRFLAYIGDGQDQIAAVQQKLKQLASTKGDINPAELMFVQVKMSQAQQEIEYSSTLLGKVIDSIKTIMNTQL